jgi:hypothetical protein
LLAAGDREAVQSPSAPANTMPTAALGARVASDYRRIAMDEAKLREKLARIEALFSGATTEGERVAAAEARKRIQLRLQTVEKREPAIEYRFTLNELWARKVLIALLRRYDLKPYRYRGQRHTTVMVKVPESFVNDTLWPEYQQIASTLRSYIDQITDRIVADVIHGDSSDAEEKREPPKLGAGVVADDK